MNLTLATKKGSRSQRPIGNTVLRTPTKLPNALCNPTSLYLISLVKPFCTSLPGWTAVYTPSYCYFSAILCVCYSSCMLYHSCQFYFRPPIVEVTLTYEMHS
ncbi:hypothetical protein HHX47_DHR1001074, partial [Lentinula edodes]